MRERQPRGSTAWFIVVIGILALALLPPGIGDEEETQLYLMITGTAEEEEPITEVYENEYFKVSAYLLDEHDFPQFQANVIITFNDNSYQTTEDDIEVLLVAPLVTSNTVLNISASKEECIGANASLTVLNHLRLILTPETFTVEAGHHFSIVVTDETGAPVSGVIVGIQNEKGDDAVDTTNSDGRAWLMAPEDRREIIILAQKDGYLDGTRMLRVNIPQGIIERVLHHPFTPIVIAVVLLVSIVGIVYMRQRRASPLSPMDFKEEQRFPPTRTPGTITSKTLSAPDMAPKRSTATNVDLGGKPKVEEIRISRPGKEKNIVPVDQTNPSSVPLKKKPIKGARCDWFEGTEDFRYQIDKMTGKIDETKTDKWFEGTSDIRKKIDKALKQKDREKTKRK